VVLDLLHAPRFADQAPAEIYATLPDDGVYHYSVRTVYRLLGQHGEVRERRRQLRHPVYQKPELLAEMPNEVWSWDAARADARSSRPQRHEMPHSSNSSAHRV
jgi:putative transposase